MLTHHDSNLFLHRFNWQCNLEYITSKKGESEKKGESTHTHTHKHRHTHTPTKTQQFHVLLHCQYITSKSMCLTVQQSVTRRKMENPFCDSSIRVTWLFQMWDMTPLYVNTLQHTATYTLQHTATHCNTLQHTVTHCNTLQHTVTHCNTLQHAATRCNTLQHTATQGEQEEMMRENSRLQLQVQQASMHVKELLFTQVH